MKLPAWPSSFTCSVFWAQKLSWHKNGMFSKSAKNWFFQKKIPTQLFGS
jgi:hypothetical protein